MKVLICGAGVAGTCFAYWLGRHGFEPTIVERAPQLRTGGYIIDFWGAGFDVAERMGLVPQLLEKGYKVRELRQVDEKGERVSGFAVSAFDRITHGRYTSLPRSELARSLYDALGNEVETIFDDTVAAVEDSGREVRVRFEHAAPRTFDVVVGADGLHSEVRRLVFGDEARFERFLGMKVAAFAAEGYRPRDELVYLMHREVLRQEEGCICTPPDRSSHASMLPRATATTPSATSPTASSPSRSPTSVRCQATRRLCHIAPVRSSLTVGG